MGPKAGRGAAPPPVFPKVKGKVPDGAGGFPSDAVGRETAPGAPKLKIPVGAPPAGAGVLPKAGAAPAPAPEVPKEKAEELVEAAGDGSGILEAPPKENTPAPDSAAPAGLASRTFSDDGAAPKVMGGAAPVPKAPKLKAGACAGATAVPAGAGAPDAAGEAPPNRKGVLGCESGGDCCESGVLPKVRGADDGDAAAGAGVDWPAAGVVGPAADPPKEKILEGAGCGPSPAGTGKGAGSATGFAAPNEKLAAEAELGAGSAAGLDMPKAKLIAAAGPASAAGFAPPTLKRPPEGRLGGAKQEGARAGSDSAAGCLNPKDREGVDGGAGGMKGVDAAGGAGLAPVQVAGLVSLEKL